MVGGTDNGRQKPETARDVIVAESYLLITRSPSQTCHAKPKLKSRRRTLPASSRYGCLPQAAYLKDFSPEKSGRCGIAADCLSGRFTYD